MTELNCSDCAVCGTAQIEYSNGDKFIAEISQETINEIFDCVLDDIRTIKYKEFKEKEND